MREILFKAKRLDNGEWVEGYYLKCPHQYSGFLADHISVSKYDEEESSIEHIYPIDPETVGQFTGLTDKNGQKIWENDIIDAKDSWWNAYGPAGHSSPIILVEWSDYFCGYEPFANYDCDCGVYICPDEVKVIGNIFDNPELLKEGAE